MNILKTGQNVYYIQVWEGKKPKFKLFNSPNEIRLSKDEKGVGLGKLVMTKKPKLFELGPFPLETITIYQGYVDLKHLAAYEKNKKNLEFNLDRKTCKKYNYSKKQEHHDIGWLRNAAAI